MLRKILLALSVMTTLTAYSAGNPTVFHAVLCEQSDSAAEASQKLTSRLRKNNLVAVTVANQQTGNPEQAYFRVQNLSAPSVAVDPHPTNASEKYTVCVTAYKQ